MQASSGSLGLLPMVAVIFSSADAMATAETLRMDRQTVAPKSGCVFMMWYPQSCRGIRRFGGRSSA